MTSSPHRIGMTSAIADALSGGSWFLQAAGGGYLVAAHDGNGANLTTVPTRDQAAQFDFTVLSTISPQNVSTRIQEVKSGRCLGVDGHGTVVLGAQPSSGSSFTVGQRGPTTFFLLWAPSGASGGGAVVFGADTERFVVGPPPATPLRVATDPPDGRLVWRRKIAAGVLGGPATFGEHQVIAGTTPTLVCLDTATGLVEWNHGAVAATSPATVDMTTRLAIVAVGNEIRAVSVDTAEPRWSTIVSSRVEVRPLAFGHQIFVCASGGVLHALRSSDGAPVWRYPSGSSTVGGLRAAPALGKGNVYVGAGDGTLYAVSARTGERRWSFPTGAAIACRPLVTESAVIVGNDRGGVFARGLDDGAALWRATVPGAVVASPAVQGEVVLVGTTAGDVHGLDLASGVRRWPPVRVSGPVVHDLEASDGVAYVTAADQLCVLRLSTGSPQLTTASLQGPAAGEATVFSGTVNTTTTTGYQVSFSPDLRTDMRSEDFSTLLQVSWWADRVADPDSPPAPPSWRIVASARAQGPNAYGTALLVQLRRPSDDRLTLVIAFGVEYTAFLNHYADDRAQLVALDTGAEVGTSTSDPRVTDTVLADYRQLRGRVLAFAEFFKHEAIIVTGQGQGGAFAALCAYDLTVPAPDVRPAASLGCVTFGAPPTGNQAFGNQFAQAVPASTRVVRPEDITVDSLLLRGWSHATGATTVSQGFPEPVGLGTVASYAQPLTDAE